MKLIITLLAGFALTLNAFSQGMGTVAWAWGTAYGPFTDNTKFVQSATASDFTGLAKIGSTAYPTANFVCELWGGSAENNIAPLARAPFLTAPARLQGTVNSGQDVSIPGTVQRGSAYVQVRVWDSSGGVQNWAQLTDQTLRGYTPLTQLSGLGGPGIPEQSIPPEGGRVLTSLGSFNLYVIPEPSVIALGVLGLGALVLFRRRKN